MTVMTHLQLILLCENIGIGNTIFWPFCNRLSAILYAESFKNPADSDGPGIDVPGSDREPSRHLAA